MILFAIVFFKNLLTKQKRAPNLHSQKNKVGLKEGSEESAPKLKHINEGALQKKWQERKDRGIKRLFL